MSRLHVFPNEVVCGAAINACYGAQADLLREKSKMLLTVAQSLLFLCASSLGRLIHTQESSPWLGLVPSWQCTVSKSQPQQARACTRPRPRARARGVRAARAAPV